MYLYEPLSLLFLQLNCSLDICNRFDSNAAITGNHANIAGGLGFQMLIDLNLYYFVQIQELPVVPVMVQVQGLDSGVD